MKAKPYLPLIFISLIQFGTLKAAVIDMGNYQLDNATGLEWLDLSLTTQMTVQDAVAAYAGDGWMLATEAQFLTMYSNYDGTISDNAVYGYTENYGTNFSGFEFSSTNDALDQSYYAIPFRDDFGETYNNTDISTGFNSVFSIGLYQDALNPTVMRIGGVQIDVNPNIGIGGDRVFNYYDYDGTDYTATTEYNFGTFLVRQGVSQVPLPASIWLFSTALVGFIGLSRRRKIA